MNLRLAASLLDPRRIPTSRFGNESAARLRRESPVLCVSMPGAMIRLRPPRHADVTEIECRNDTFGNPLNSNPREHGAIKAARTQSAAVKRLIHIDGAWMRPSSAYRQITNDWFELANLRRTLGGAIRRLARLSVDRLLEFDGRCGFAADTASCPG